MPFALLGRVGRIYMAEISRPTIKRLFAVSRNRCAFRNCPQPLVDESSGKVVAKICHIKGNNPGSARYDPAQTEDDRQSFGNLILMCPIHHDVIDADAAAYTVEVLIKRKAEHEELGRGQDAPNERMTDLFLANVSLAPTDGSVILTHYQSGGQAAHIIHNNYGSAPEQASAFRRELIGRNLSDIEDTKFANTTYSKKLGMMTDNRKTVPLGTAALLFAHLGKPLFKEPEEQTFLQWMDVNKRRYSPCTAYPFVPGVIPDRLGKTYLWNDAGMLLQPPGARFFSNYLAVERSGFLEHGFDPMGIMAENQSVYYATVVARTVGFLSFLMDMGNGLSFAASDFSLGLAIRGTNDKQLVCVTKRLERQFVPIPICDRANFLYLRPSEEGPLEVHRAARDIADALLEHWSFVRPSWLETPEFSNEAYTGEFFRAHFSRW